jgi:anti-sigma factor RsiW
MADGMSMHWLHVRGWRGKRLSAYAAAELPPAEHARVASVVATCAACQREVEAYRRATAALREASQVHLTAAEAGAFLPAVNRRIDEGRATRPQPVRPGLREFVWDHRRLSLASALTMVVLIVGLTLSQWQRWGLSGTRGLNGVEVISVDVSEDASVMVFQAPGSSLKVIWVFEDSSI